MNKKYKIIISVLFAAVFLLAFTSRLSPPPSDWYQQFMPDLGGMPISDVFFLDSLTGWAVTNNNMPNDSGYVLKTTNAGDNWIIKLKDRRDFSRIKFINSNTGFTCGGTGSGTPFFYKSTNGGDNWFVVNSMGCALWKDMSVLSEDTMVGG
jgi:photosystem II stability/assembly factor-like uncharacterized protein